MAENGLLAGLHGVVDINVDWLCLAYREEISAALNRLRSISRLVVKAQDSRYRRGSLAPQSGEIIKLWGWLRGLRNDVAHCAMNSGGAGAESVKQRAMELPRRLGSLLGLNGGTDI